MVVAPGVDDSILGSQRYTSDLGQFKRNAVNGSTQQEEFISASYILRY
jgi:hypothetical protein